MEADLLARRGSGRRRNPGLQSSPPGCPPRAAPPAPRGRRAPRRDRTERSTPHAAPGGTGARRGPCPQARAGRRRRRRTLARGAPRCRGQGRGRRSQPPGQTRPARERRIGDGRGGPGVHAAPGLSRRPATRVSAVGRPAISVSAFTSRGSGDAHAVAGARTVIVDGREVLGEDLGRGRPGRGVSQPETGDGALGAAGALRGRGHAAVGDARLATRPRTIRKRNAPRRAEMSWSKALRDLVAAEVFALAEPGHPDAGEDLARRAVLAAVVEEEVLKGQPSTGVAVTQLDGGAERDQHRRRIADRGAVGDVPGRRCRRRAPASSRGGAASPPRRGRGRGALLRPRRRSRRRRSRSGRSPPRLRAGTRRGRCARCVAARGAAW